MSDIKFLDNNNEIIRIDAEGFHYRGQFIEDAGEARRLLVEFLRKPAKRSLQARFLINIFTTRTHFNYQLFFQFFIVVILGFLCSPLTWIAIHRILTKTQ